ncbi:succinate dehydrogenase [Deferribacter autotrophicus]|uniref:Succinate dehydrogenase n=1 Tax=Deferribacter autotrophicus TaxID=500465 RepID=A0A5A8F1W4_9BACT|nr:succinate dehydrogenase [Deferribacter autotrophicus]KAA0257942.1 succinate dehydrogenase [Deferribacter autotrophicus]
MKYYKFMGSSDRGVFEWLMQRISGVILILVIFIHFFSMIKSGEWGLKKIVLGPLFAFGIFHTLNGFKMITDDYVSSPIWRAIILAIYWIVGITLAILALSVVASL